MRQLGRAFLLALVTAAVLAGCHQHTATDAECRAILDRLVEMELAESGFHDPTLVPRWQDELARRFVDDLQRCRTIQVREDLPGCLRAARNPEEIAHRCVK
jgi:hypothetical protein